MEACELRRTSVGTIKRHHAAANDVARQRARAFAAILTVLCVTHVLVTFSWAALMLTAVWLIVVAIRAWALKKQGRLLMSGLAVVLLIVLLSPVSQSYFANVGKAATAVPASPAKPLVVLGSTVTDASTEERLGAIRRGVGLGIAHGGLGIGHGQYPRYDPIATSAHSLLLSMWVEGGIASLAGLCVLFAWLVWRASRLLVRSRPGRMDDMILAASPGGVCFLLEGFIVGSNLALDGMGVWGMILAILVGIASQRGEADPHASTSSTGSSDSPASR
jgi:O-antigen ligase